MQKKNFMLPTKPIVIQLKKVNDKETKSTIKEFKA